MPELPEVELVTRTLNTLISGRKIVGAKLIREKLAPHHTKAGFTKLIRGSKINFAHRRGKHILIALDNDRTLMVHLRMSGRFMLLPEERELPKFTHAIFELDNGERLVFQDQRHFGFMRVEKTSTLPRAKELVSLAPEPFSDEFSLEYFQGVISKSSRSLKEFLLDQTKVLGLGNIYACEAMFLAKVNPRKPANTVPKRKIEPLFMMIRQVLNESIRFSKKLRIDPENIDGSYFGGAHGNHWRVYDREGEPCVECDAKIKRIPQGGRSTYFCPRCQR
jgi:formamidopyrimidine-DNA glycosylase